MRRKAKIDVDGYYVTSSGLQSHFNVRELQCRCGCGARNVDESLIDALEKVREFFGGVPIIPNSGVRCWTYNKKIGGAKASQHLPRDASGVIDQRSGDRHDSFGRACDFTIKDVTPKMIQSKLHNKLHKFGLRGLGKYKGFTHVDVRAGAVAEWEG